MTCISKAEAQRLKYINFVMEELHVSLSNIYESMVDKEYDVLKKEVSIMTKNLKSITETTEDET